MATLAKFAASSDVSGYTSDRVFDGVRKLDANAAARHRDRLKKALSKRQCAPTAT